MSADRRGAGSAGHLGVVVVGAGSGTRLGGVDKALLEVAGRPLLAHAVAAFEAMDEVEAIALVVARARLDDAGEVVRQNGWRKVVAVVAGGATRQESVEIGLAALPPVELVAVHDAARPVVEASVVRLGIDAARRHGAAIAAIPVRDTLKRIGPDGATIAGTVDRDGLWAAQTPQVFLAKRLREAHAVVGARAAAFTDDAGIVEAAGFPVAIVAGTLAGVKVTHPDDLEVVQAVLGARAAGVHATPPPTPSVRVGVGYDLHRLAAGRALVLGGVSIPHDLGCLGHSDGDAVAHAVIDALLGACALGDIGALFPPGDERFRDADSIGLLRATVTHLATAGFRPASVDATVVLERPRLARHLEAMRDRLGGAMGLAPSMVSVKAKTNEGVDAVGRGEAVAVHAVAMVIGTGAAG